MDAPRISLNKFAEYLITAVPARRNRILHDQKFGNPPVAPLYAGFRDPVIEFLARGGTEPDIIYEAVERLRGKTGSDWTETDAENTALALEKFLCLAPRFLKPGLSFKKGPRGAALVIGGIEISVAPDLLILTERRGVPVVGAIKFYLVKDEKKKLGAEGGQYVAAILRQWLASHGPQDRRCDPSLCLFVECWHGTITSAPTAMTVRMRNILAAGREIAALWPTIQQDEDRAA